MYGFICRYVQIAEWVDGRNPYEKMDRPLLYSPAQLLYMLYSGSDALNTNTWP